MAEKPKGKVFCIGMNKTGTTSLEKFMELHGFSAGNQARGELLLTDFVKGNFIPIIDFCETADFFQDLPFSAPGCFKVLLNAFPEAKYILTVRDSAEVWYESLVRFHESVFGKPLTKELLQEAAYRYRGFAWMANRALYRSPDDDPYNRESLIETYEQHRLNVLNTFGDSKNLLVLNMGEEKVVKKLANFLQIEPKVEKMPWLNKTADA